MEWMESLVAVDVGARRPRMRRRSRIHIRGYEGRLMKEISDDENDEDAYQRL